MAISALEFAQGFSYSATLGADGGQAWAKIRDHRTGRTVDQRVVCHCGADRIAALGVNDTRGPVAALFTCGHITVDAPLSAQGIVDRVRRGDINGTWVP